MTVFKNEDRVEVSNNEKDWYPAIFFGEYKCKFIVVRNCADLPSLWPHCRHPRPDWPVDHPIQVRDSESGKWHNMHFAGWGDDGRVKVWRNGATSHSVEFVSGRNNAETSWRLWQEVPKER